MSPEEARLLLSARRPGGEDDALPEMAEALAAAAADAPLGEWLAKEAAFDGAITARLREHGIPDGLRARILAGMRGSAAESPADHSPDVSLALDSDPGRAPYKSSESSASSAKTGRSGISRRSLLWGLSSGAAAALATGLALALRKSLPGLAQFRADMVDFFDHRFEEKFDHKESNPARLVAWLKARPQSVDFSPPGNLSDGRTLGCRFISWGGTGVTLVCFMPPNSPQPIHVFTVASTALASAGPAVPIYGRQSEWNTAMWAVNDHTLLAISPLPEPAMRRHLGV